MEKIKVVKNVYFFLMVSCIISIITQLPVFQHSSLKNLSIIVWITVFFQCLRYMKFISINKSIMACIFMVIIYDAIILGGSLIDAKFMQSKFFYLINLSLFITLVGYFSSYLIEKEKFEKILLYLAYISVAFSAIIFSEFYVGNNFMVANYLYADKNSASTITLVGIIILAALWNPNNKMMRLIKIIILLFMSFLILIFKSRATTVGAGVSLVIYIVLRFKKKVRPLNFIAILISTSAIGLYMILNLESIWELISSMLFNNLDISLNNIDVITAGRISHLIEFNNIFWEAPMFGRGDYYLESFPLAILVESGIVGALPIAAFSYYPLVWCLKKDKKAIVSNKIVTILFLVSINMSLNSIFENLSPLGPGVKCFVLWLVFGYVLGKYEGNKIIKE